MMRPLKRKKNGSESCDLRGEAPRRQRTVAVMFRKGSGGTLRWVVFIRFERMAEAVALKTAVQDPENVSQLVEHLFRHEAGKMVATLTKIFGIEHLTLAEDVVQEALARALQTWPFYGVPKNPSAWIMRASRNLALDVGPAPKGLPEQASGNYSFDGSRDCRGG